MSSQPHLFQHPEARPPPLYSSSPALVAGEGVAVASTSPAVEVDDGVASAAGERVAVASTSSAAEVDDGVASVAGEEGTILLIAMHAASSRHSCEKPT